MIGKIDTVHNSTYKKLAVQWLNQALCFVSRSVLADSLVLRNPLLRQALLNIRTIKYIFLLLALNFNGNLIAQEIETTYHFSAIYPCESIIDSLTRVNYFDKCLQVNPNKAISEFYIYINYRRGCIALIDEKFELVFNGYKGYLIKSRQDANESYKAITEINTIVEMLEKLNKTYAFDDVLLIKGPLAHNTSGSANGKLIINLKFSDGEIINRDYHFEGINNYCGFFPEFYRYYTNLFVRSFKPLDSLSASRLLGFDSKIAFNYLYDPKPNEPYEIDSPRLKPLGLNIDKCIIPMRILEKSSKH